ncbi:MULTISPECIES: endonuclease/exonuclease/phosphatase family protein [unclassified Streptomyces]|uniref:endonuclease/exonuclease/phosphatase family protein n=1 Tax=unclassified Streptomyces TaxID=2593676 RepID=UPI002DDAFE72|nr:MULTISPECIES: endonuclease/exonuclease/phosphatase family protein [unclassified Streptomyces]WSC55726.1 endonuclease/exonuclease/phosphatase family protein [Streptomyces sp. NBC_01761]WSD24949.1 endonuclease/exonuclease/phosphatase family protein [Streptomyces sp. NBC_01751]WSJ53133.1 endonuclease/exonuclease/phosphatase family protein [Streptomyces sp. NBC_01318]
MPNLHEDPYPDVYIGGGFSDPARIPPTDSGPEQQAAPEAAPVPDEQADDRPGHMSDRHGRGYGWRKGRLPTALAVMTGIVLAGHSLVPNSVGNPGSLLETLLPWTGLAVPVLLLAALLRRSVPAGVAALLVAAVWAAMFGQLFLGGRPDAEPDLTVVTHNVGAANPDPAGTARTLLAADPDLVALEEITDDAMPAYRRVLGRRLTHSVHIGTVALWSRYPITDSERVTIDPGWSRSLRARVQGPGGPLAVYVVHLPSVRVGASGFTIARRDQVLTALDHAVDQERQKKVLLMGDLNGATTDRGLASLNSRLTSVQDEAGTGFGFSWPAAFPVARIDHILTRGVTPTEAWTLPATGSDHRPVAARLKA